LIQIDFTARSDIDGAWKTRDTTPLLPRPRMPRVYRSATASERCAEEEDGVVEAEEGTRGVLEAEGTLTFIVEDSEGARVDLAADAASDDARAVAPPAALGLAPVVGRCVTLPTVLALTSHVLDASSSGTPSMLLMPRVLRLNPSRRAERVV
jgi:hypothetical protein